MNEVRVYIYQKTYKENKRSAKSALADEEEASFSYYDSINDNYDIINCEEVLLDDECTTVYTLIRVWVELLSSN